jgi:SAM-dependent methyltransferase
VGGGGLCYSYEMATDAHSATDFYSSRRGAVAAMMLRERLARLWPSLRGQSVLGLGYAAPYLRLWREDAARCIALTPAQLGAARWPAGAPNLSCTAEEDALPFPDLCFDRVLLVHGLEAAENARRLLREVWRVLKDDGSLLVVAPNRRGMWAHVESTPFGQGAPYSPGQIGRLLAEGLFRVERRDSALYVPPTNLRVVLRGAALWERGGRRVLPHLGGVTITEAVKDVYAAVPLQAAQRRRMVLADAG